MFRLLAITTLVLLGAFNEGFAARDWTLRLVGPRETATLELDTVANDSLYVIYDGKRSALSIMDIESMSVDGASLGWYGAIGGASVGGAIGVRLFGVGGGHANYAAGVLTMGTAVLGAIAGGLALMLAETHATIDLHGLSITERGVMIMKAIEDYDK